MTESNDKNRKKPASVSNSNRYGLGGTFSRHKEVSSFSGLEHAAPDTTKSTKRTTGSSEKTEQGTGNKKR